MVPSQEHYMPSLFRIQINEEALTDELYSFITDPHPYRSRHPLIDELDDVLPEMVEVAEMMAIDGVNRRQFVAQYVEYVRHDLGA
jgi:hypothetical protein